MCNKNILVLKSLTLPIYLILFVLTFSSCVTRKKKADLSILGKIYENKIIFFLKSLELVHLDEVAILSNN